MATERSTMDTDRSRMEANHTMETAHSRPRQSATTDDALASPKRRRVDRSSLSVDPAPGPRPTQRAPRSCIECTRRKIKCDKNQPCGACSSRGDGLGCRREDVFVKGAIISGDLTQRAITLESLSKEIELLRERVTELESGRPGASDGRSAGPAPAQRTSPGEQISEVDQGRLPGTMEEIALGIGESIRWKGASLLTSRDGEGPADAAQWYQPVPFETSLSALPSQPNCRALVAYYLDEVSWMSCSVHGPTLWAEHDGFWRKLARSELKDELWLGVLFAVLSVAAFFMDENQAALRGFSSQHLKLVAAAWFDAAIATLFRCGIWTRPSIQTCQILQVLGPAFHLSGNTDLHQSLTGLERTQMRSINLHLLGSHREDPPHEVVWKEIGRRIWWNNVENDYVFIPYNRYALFPPHQFTTALPEVPDEASASSDGHLTLAYRLACYRSARLLYDVYGHLGLTDEPAYERVLAASRAHEALRSGLPADLQFDPDERSSYGLFPMACTRRRLLALILAYRCYQLHRLFFVKSFADRTYDASRRACLAAADTITAVADLGLPRVFFQLWNVTVSLVSAGIILALRVLHEARSRGPSAVEQRLRVEKLVERLRTLDDRSGIASRGAIFIAYLLQVEAEISAGQRTELRFTRESMLELVRSGPSVAPTEPRVDAAMEPAQYAASACPPEFDFAALLNDFMESV